MGLYFHRHDLFCRLARLIRQALDAEIRADWFVAVGVGRFHWVLLLCKSEKQCNLRHLTFVTFVCYIVRMGGDNTEWHEFLLLIRRIAIMVEKWVESRPWYRNRTTE